MTVGYRLERWREDRGKPERVRERQTERVKRGRENVEACVCLQAVGLKWPALTLPFTICHIPHYRERIGTAPVLISPSYTPTAISALHQSLSDSPPLAHPTCIFHIYIQSIYLTLMQSNLSATVEQGHYSPFTLLIHVSLFVSIPFSLLFFLSPLLPEHSFPLNLPSISPTMPHLQYV